MTILSDKEATLNAAVALVSDFTAMRFAGLTTRGALTGTLITFALQVGIGFVFGIAKEYQTHKEIEARIAEYTREEEERDRLN